MSGPKGIDYTIANERRAVEREQARWRALSGRARAFGQRCAALRVEGVSVHAGAQPGGTSAVIAAACAVLETAIGAAERQLEEVLAAQRGRRVDHDLGALLAELEQREQVAIRSVESSARHVAAVEAAAPAVSAEERAAAVAERHNRVARVLATLREPAPELERAGAEIVRAPASRAPLLLADLSARVRAVNTAADRRTAQRVELEQLRAEAAALLEPGTVLGRLNRAAEVLAADGDAAAELAAVRGLVTERAGVEQPERDRRYVLDAVVESLTALGYSATEVDLGTADSVLLRDAGRTGYGLVAKVGEGQIDLRTVRTEAGSGAAADTAAEQALCDRLPDLLDAIGQRGVRPGRVRRAPIGAAELRLVPLAAPDRTRTAAATRTEAAPRTARTRPAERSRE